MSSEGGESEARRVLGLIGATIAIGLLVANANLIYGLLSAVATIGSSGVVATAGLKVYQEAACQNELTSIDWGTLIPGQTYSRTVYLKNTGTVTLTLSMNTSGWTPSNAQQYITVSWNLEGAQINPSTVLTVTLTLTVNSNIQGVTGFSFNININGQQA
jgi:uncharacterized membrane protein